MLRSRRPLHWTVFAAVFALLLETAVPMFASAAARAQGKSVADICAVYGVATVALQAADGDHDEHEGHADHADHADHSGHDSDPGSHPGASHGSDHCALMALAALAPHDMGPGVLPTGTRRADSPRFASFDPIPDASAAWAARLWHGPPVVQGSTAA